MRAFLIVLSDCFAWESELKSVADIAQFSDPG